MQIDKTQKLRKCICLMENSSDETQMRCKCTKHNRIQLIHVANPIRYRKELQIQKKTTEVFPKDTNAEHDLDMLVVQFVTCDVTAVCSAFLYLVVLCVFLVRFCMCVVFICSMFSKCSASVVKMNEDDFLICLCFVFLHVFSCFSCLPFSATI